jgi:hypothetical protein
MTEAQLEALAEKVESLAVDLLILTPRVETTYRRLRELERVVLPKCSGANAMEPKPPLGLKPRRIIAEERLEEVEAAIRRFAIYGRTAPIEWLQERDELLDYLHGRGIHVCTCD